MILNTDLFFWKSFYLLIKNPGKYFNKEELAKSIWQNEYDPSIHDKLVYTSVSRLRKIIEPDSSDEHRHKYIIRSKDGYSFNSKAKVRFCDGFLTNIEKTVANVELESTCVKIWILFSVLSIFAESKKGVLIVKDLAVFRMNTTVYMLSDLKDYLQNIDVLRCFSKRSYLLGTLQLSSDKQKKLPSYEMLSANLVQHEEFLSKILKMIKIEFFANGQKVDTSTDIFSKLGIRDCTTRNWKKWPDRLKSLIHTELFLRNRYGKGEKAKETNRVIFANYG